MHQNPYQAPASDGAAYGGVVAAGGEYEFNDFENHTIAKLAKRCSVWGVISLISGGFCALGIIALLAFMSEIPNEAAVVVGIGAAFLGPAAIVYLAIGGLYIGSGRALRLVVDTQGNDIEHLLGGISKLGKAFMIEVIISIFAVVVGLGFAGWAMSL